MTPLSNKGYKLNNMKVLSVFGTRPEAIKMVPIVKAVEAHPNLQGYTCLTAQHREMLDQVVNLFDIKVDFDLDLMQKNQGLTDLISRIITSVSKVLDEVQPDVVLVHGDTATTMAVSVACFYKQIAIGHVEAGLRTGNLYSPWPEEANRRVAGLFSSLHFCPTPTSQNNLLLEGVDKSNTFVVGNTVIDTLFMTLERINSDEKISIALNKQFAPYLSLEKMVLITGHRRENFGDGFKNICKSIAELARRYPNVAFIYPVHLNPNVQEPVNKYLSGISNVHLIEPLQYVPFIYLMNKADIVLTDSGGIQEEAPSLGKPVLVMRDTTERPEGVEAGTVRLVGTDISKIIEGVSELLDSKDAYKAMSEAHNPYGDGITGKRVADILFNSLVKE